MLYALKTMADNLRLRLVLDGARGGGGLEVDAPDLLADGGFRVGLRKIGLDRDLMLCELLNARHDRGNQFLSTGFMEDIAESVEGCLFRDGVVSTDTGLPLKDGDDLSDNVWVALVKGLRCADRLDKIMILLARDAEDLIASRSCELHPAGADAAARTPDQQCLALRALARRHPEREKALLKKARGGRVDG